MIFYKKLSQISFLRKSYAFKFLFVAFIGTHIPLIGLLFFILYEDFSISPNTMLIVALLMTLFASAITLLVLKQLIKPIEFASKALRNYKKERLIPNLPTTYNDEAGFLMRNIQETILEHERFIDEKQDLVYLLSHDLKNFAGQPQALANFIIETKPSEEVVELAELIYQSSKHQFQYIENFIKLLKEQDEVNTSLIEPTLIRFSSVVSEVEKQLHQLLLIKKIQFHIEVGVEEATLPIDEELLVRVIMNLLDNAIKFSFVGGRIFLRVFSENEKIQIVVQDNGLGFDSSQKEELFQKFTKMSKLGTANEPSTGIGLYLCRKIIDKSKGKLTAYSDGAGKGAVFTIVFD